MEAAAHVFQPPKGGQFPHPAYAYGRPCIYSASIASLRQKLYLKSFSRDHSNAAYIIRQLT